MKLLPKKNEYQRVLELIRDESYEDSDAGDIQLAKDIVKAVAEELSRRESFVVVESPGDDVFEMLWPFWYEADAHRFHTSTPVPYRRVIGKMRSPWVDQEIADKHPKGTEKVA